MKCTILGIIAYFVKLINFISNVLKNPSLSTTLQIIKYPIYIPLKKNDYVEEINYINKLLTILFHCSHMILMFKTREIKKTTNFCNVISMANREEWDEYSNIMKFLTAHETFILTHDKKIITNEIFIPFLFLHNIIKEYDFYIKF